MRDGLKACGITIHQKLDSSTGKIGEKCPEYPFKDAKGVKKRKIYHPPTDHVQKVYLEILDPKLPFSVFLWYNKQIESDPDMCCVDLTVDGRRSPGWMLQNGRQNGILVDCITHKGSQLPFEFSPARVMKLEKDEDDQMEYIPDEGLPALAVLTLFYRDHDFLSKHNIIKPKKSLLKRHLLNSELSTTLSSPIVKSNHRFEFEGLLDLDDVDMERPPLSVINMDDNECVKSKKIRKEVDLDQSTDVFVNEDGQRYGSFVQLLKTIDNLEGANTDTRPSEDLPTDPFRSDLLDSEENMFEQLAATPNATKYHETSLAHHLDENTDELSVEENREALLGLCSLKYLPKLPSFVRRKRIPVTWNRNAAANIVYRITLDKGDDFSNLFSRLKELSGLKMVSTLEWTNKAGISTHLGELRDIDEIVAITIFSEE